MDEITIHSVLHKTAAGQAAIKLHDRSLPPKVRTLLIMVDGAKSLKDLSPLAPDPVALVEMANSLLSAGLVEVDKTRSIKPAAPVSAPAPLQAAAAPAAAGAPMPPRDLKSTAMKASRALQDLLGPSADPLCLQIERCKTMDELVARIYAIQPVVASMRSPQKAEAFVQAALAP